eukprot:1318323-Amphidinium_carterae.1
MGKLMNWPTKALLLMARWIRMFPGLVRLALRTRFFTLGLVRNFQRDPTASLVSGYRPSALPTWTASSCGTSRRPRSVSRLWTPDWQG